MVARKRIRNKTAAYFGGHGWSGGAFQEMKRILEPLKWDIQDTLEYVGSPTARDLKQAEEFGFRFGRRLLSPDS